MEESRSTGPLAVLMVEVLYLKFVDISDFKFYCVATLPPYFPRSYKQNSEFNGNSLEIRNSEPLHFTDRDVISIAVYPLQKLSSCSIMFRVVNL